MVKWYGNSNNDKLNLKTSVFIFEKNGHILTPLADLTPVK